jgi:hypothetical protein
MNQNRRPSILIASVFILPALAVSAACGNAFSDRSGISTGSVSSDLNLRQDPSTSAPVVAVLKAGETVSIHSRVGEWLKVSNVRHSGYVAARFIKVLGDSGLAQERGEKFLPAHRRILEEAGWLEFADRNIDVLKYFDAPYFHTPDGPASGVAFCWGRQRVTHIALNGYTDEQVAAVIVHEATHLAGLTQIGACHSQEMAYGVQAQFERDLAKVRGHQARETRGAWAVADITVEVGR